MWIVRLALRRPHSVAVMALLMLVLGVLSFTHMNADIFPVINLPVVEVIWSYPGLSALMMERRMVWISERAMSTTVNGIEHIESTAMDGLGMLRVYFHGDQDVGGAIAQIDSVSQGILHIMPPGTTAPTIVDFNAANVPVAQLNVYSDTMSEQALFDYGLNFIRVKLFTIEGLSSPAPFGGVSRAMMVNLHPEALYAQGLSPADISTSINQSSVTIPGGTAKIGNREYNVEINGTPDEASQFDQLPVKVSGRTTVMLRDVAPVTYSHQVQTNVVRVDGKRATYLAIIKHAAASTLTVVNSVKAAIPDIVATAPKGLQLKLTFDQSIFVREALWEVVREAAVAAGLVALMVLLFLGSPRSMFIVIASIPLSILTAIVGLKLSGQTINTMTLGGLALAVGMLVDDATVEIENIHRNHAMPKPLLSAILDGASQIAAPTLIGTLSICIVFFPVVLLYGVARFLFTPLALAVVYAMLTSYLLSRTLVPTLAHRLLPEHHVTAAPRHAFGRMLVAFDAGFERFREGFRGALGAFIARRAFSLGCVALIVLGSIALVPVVGEDFFPEVDAGLMRMHVRAASGTRIEQTERIVDNVERAIRGVIPADELDSISDNIDLPTYFNLSYYQTDSIGPQDADVLISLTPKHHPTAGYQQKVRAVLAHDFPDVQVYFQAADMVSQVLNFGLSAPIDAQISGNSLEGDYAVARALRNEMMKIPGLVDIRIAERLDYPTLRVKVDRAKALQLGVTEQQVASSLLTSLSSSTLLAPNFWLDPQNGVNYSVLTQTPPHMIDSVEALAATPLDAGTLSQSNPGRPPQLLGNVATIAQDVEPAVINHYTVQRVFDVNCSVSGRDLGSATAAVQKAIESMGKLPPGIKIVIRGQSQAMHESFASLEQGLVLAIILVYLLMVTNFQSWAEPFIILLAVPGALAGVLWILVLTHNTINVESLMGAIMAVGVGVANGNLLIIFANDLREQGYSATAAAIEAARTRLRPVVMTALAMLLGMLPMALGASLNAPLGLAVIGGLLVATLMTLFVVPAAYSLLGTHLITKHQRDAEIEAILLPGA
jgi:multidrug efflux pump subunit AcrB